MSGGLILAFYWGIVPFICGYFLSGSSNMDYNPEFNGSLATLERISNLLDDCSTYRVNEHIIGFRNNLYALWKEARPFLKSNEQKKGDFIRGIQIISSDDEGFIYDPEDLEILDLFDLWLRKRLVEERITFRKGDTTTRIQRLEQRYGLNEGNPQPNKIQ